MHKTFVFKINNLYICLKMSSFFVHYSWFLVFSLSRLMFLVLAIFLTLHSIRIIISFDLFSSWFIKLSVSFSFDLFSSWFRFVVTLISSVIIIYSFFYISPYSKVNYFIWLTSFFVLSMLIVININNFLFVILGWDGLGLVSFFLIVFYQNYSSIYSGLFTVLINRVGDCFFIVSISIIIFSYSTIWNDGLRYSSYLIVFMMLLTFMTKRAIYPFSPWLPLAMAAPTPISALVHSSTLVTAGLYLSMRFYRIFYSYPSIMLIFLVLSVFTSFYAGMNAIFETDIKKLIALSTLSHLGFIGMAFSCGLLYLSFFHLLVHALFKSVLFISMGDIITNLFHSQDIRFLSSGYYYTPSSFYIIAVSLINLLGLPTIRGYFSKDFVLETCNFSFISYFLLFLIFFNLLFTYYYTYQLFYFSFRTLKFTPYRLVHSSSLTHTFCLLFISILGTVFGYLWITYIIVFTLHVTVPLIWKLTPYFINVLILLYLFTNLQLFKLNQTKVSYYFSNIIFLSCVIITFMSNSFLASRFYSCKSSEFGLFSWALNKNLPDIVSSVRLSLYKLFSINSLFIAFVSVFFVFFLLLLLLCNIIYYVQLLLVTSHTQAQQDHPSPNSPTMVILVYTYV